MRTDHLIEQEIRRLAREIKEICHNDGDADWEHEVQKIVKKYDLTVEERDKLRDLIQR